MCRLLLGDDGSEKVDVGDVVAAEVVGDAVDDLYGCGGVDEVGGSDLNCGSASHDELESVVGVDDAPEPDDGNLDSSSDLPHHADGNRPDSGTGESTGDCGY